MKNLINSFQYEWSVIIKARAMINGKNEPADNGFTSHVYFTLWYRWEGKCNFLFHTLFFLNPSNGPSCGHRVCQEKMVPYCLMNVMMITTNHAVSHLWHIIRSSPAHHLLTTLIYSIHSPLPPQTFHTETSSYKPLSVAWEKVRGDDHTWLGAKDVISADTESVLVWIHGYNFRTGNLWKSKNGVRNKTGSIRLLKRFERKSVWSTSANPLFTWSPPLSPALLPMSRLSFFLSVGSPHLFICALYLGIVQ